MVEDRAIAVVGDGTTAVVVAACLASLGHRVVGVEANQTRLRALGTTRAPVFEPGLADLLQDHQRSKRLVFGVDLRIAVRQADVTFLCVEGRSEPSDRPGESIAAAVRSIGEAAVRGHVIVVTTAVPMGDGTLLRSIIEGALAEDGDRPSLVSNPSFMRAGWAVRDFLNPEHVVIGSDDPEALDRVTGLLRSILDQSHAGGNPKQKPDFIQTDLATAERIKRAVSDTVARAGSDTRRAGDGRPILALSDGSLPRAVGFDDWLTRPPFYARNGGSGSRNIRAHEPIGNGATTRQEAPERTGKGVGVIPQWKRPLHHPDRASNPTITVVIPTLNEANNLPHVASRLPDFVDEVVIVDGRSTDGTVDVARRVLPDCVVVLEHRPGKGAALRSGFEMATSDIIVMLDADGSTDPQEIPAFVGMLVAGADLVKGSRFVQGGGTDDMERHRRFGNRILTMLVNLAFGGRYSDLCYGYNAVWRDALPAMGLDADGFEIETLMGIRALRAGLEIAEVPSFECPRIHGTSNLHGVRDGLRILRTIIRERLRPFRTTTETAPVDIGVEALDGGLPSWAALDADLVRN